MESVKDNTHFVPGPVSQTGLLRAKLTPLNLQTHQEPAAELEAVRRSGQCCRSVLGSESAYWRGAFVRERL